MASLRARWTLTAAIGFGGAAALISVVAGLLMGFPNPFSIAVVVSATLTGGVLWYALVEHHDAEPVSRGAAAGVLTGLLAHIPLWFLMMVQEPQSSVNHPSTVVSLVTLSILFGGWVTVPLAGTAGLMLGLVRRYDTGQ